LGTQWGSAIHNIADIPFFVDSRASRLTQCADAIAYAVFRRFNSGDTQYFDLIAGRLYASEDGVIHGLSHKTQASIALHCMCPACLSRRLART
jgi:glycogen debranching enzyme